MSEIIVGVDGSAGSRTALRWAARAARARGSGLRVIGAWQYPASAGSPTGPAHPPGPTEMDQRTHDDLRNVVRDELGDDDADRVSIVAGRGPASQVLLAAAARPGVDLMVLGARGLGGFGGLLLGSVSQQCVEHSPCPAVVFRGDGELADGPLVVGLDGSDGSARALTWSLELATATGAGLVVVHASNVLASEEEVEAVRVAQERWRTELASGAVPHEVVVESGDARSVLERVADERAASLLVVGSRGLGPVRGLLLGSVAGYVARYSRRPIAVVPPPV